MSGRREHRQYSDLKMVSDHPFMRDVLIQKIQQRAAIDSSIFFLTGDMGAPALDQFRDQLPNNMIHCGISEQHMISFAAGLALEGNLPFCFTLAPFVTARCYEQIKCSVAAMNQPVVLIGLGPGLSYADAGPTHYATEDIAIIDALPNFRIFTPADHISVDHLTERCFSERLPTYIRIDRDSIPPIYSENLDPSTFSGGCVELETGTDACIISSGYALQRAKKTIQELGKHGKSIGLVDLFQPKPLIENKLTKILKGYKKIIIIDEQSVPGGIASILLSHINTNQLSCSLLSIGLKKEFFFENGGRDFLLDQNGLEINGMVRDILDFI